MKGPGATGIRLAVLAWGALLLAACDPQSVAEQGANESPTPPNIVILFADDLGYGDLGSFGHPTIRTPHLDQMAREGLRMTDFYVAAPVCSPSRGALLTGRLPVRTGLYGERIGVYFPDDPGGLPERELTLAEVLRDAGYATAVFGKWHLGDRPEAWPTRHGFDEWLGLPYSNDMDWEVGMDFPETLRAVASGRTEDLAADRAKKRAAYFAPEVDFWNVPLFESRRTGDTFEDRTVERPADQTTLTERYTDRALQFLKQRQADSRPFLLYVPYTMPHVPLFRSADFEGQSLAGLYGDVIEELDANVGRIAQALRQGGLAENTLVVFTSDNGPWRTLNQHGGSAGLLRGGKGETFEGGMRVPAIFWWPGVIAPGVSSVPRSTLDIFPTALALAGVPAPEEISLDGTDLMPLLRDREPASDEGIAYYRSGELRAWRQGRFKLHFVTEGAYGAPPARAEHDPPLLYDLHRDPEERFDVAAEHPEVVAAIESTVAHHRASFERAPPEFDRRLNPPSP